MNDDDDDDDDEVDCPGTVTTMQLWGEWLNSVFNIGPSLES